MIPETLMGFYEAHTDGRAFIESDHLMEQVVGTSNAVVICAYKDVLSLSMLV